jgi:hypothetical protein
LKIEISMWSVWNLKIEMFKYQKLKTKMFEYWKLKIEMSEYWKLKIEMLKYWKLKTKMFEYWKLKCLNIKNLNVWILKKKKTEKPLPFKTTMVKLISKCIVVSISYKNHQNV